MKIAFNFEEVYVYLEWLTFVGTMVVDRRTVFTGVLVMVLDRNSKTAESGVEGMFDFSLFPYLPPFLYFSTSSELPIRKEQSNFMFNFIFLN